MREIIKQILKEEESRDDLIRRVNNGEERLNLNFPRGITSQEEYINICKTLLKLFPTLKWASREDLLQNRKPKTISNLRIGTDELAPGQIVLSMWYGSETDPWGTDGYEFLLGTNTIDFF